MFTHSEGGGVLGTSTDKLGTLAKSEFSIRQFLWQGFTVILAANFTMYFEAFA